MERQDKNMPFLLQYENVAWYCDGIVRILDRRVYPSKIEYVECQDYTQVAQAIKDMVTQSTGPYAAVAMGMVLAAKQVEGKASQAQTSYLKNAAKILGTARPTAANRYSAITNTCLQAALKAIENNEDVVQATFDCAVQTMNERYTKMQKVGDNLCVIIPDGGSILTQCYAETVIGTLIRAAKSAGKRFKVFCAETRPYFQGARLTSSCFASSGFDTTVIGDNMVAYTMENEGIDIFTCAADTITLDGHVANKVGTSQIAILARHFGVPMYVTGMPDAGKLTRADIVIEQRDPRQLLEINGVRNTLPETKGLYPSFDITPPEMITGFVTDVGILKPAELKNYSSNDNITA